MKKITSYKFKHVDMLLAVLVILKSLRDNIEELSAFRKEWTLAFVDDLILRTKEAMRKYLGVDYRSDLREATGRVQEIVATARRDLNLLKVQIKADFNDQEADNILTKLGYSRYYKAVQQNDQESLMNLLYGIQSAMDDGVRDLLISRGSNEELIDRLPGYASALEQANLDQEGLKGMWHVPSKEARMEFQSIYEEAIRICKLAYAYYSGNPLKQPLFSFSRVVRNVNSRNTSGKEEPLAEV